MIVHQVQPKQDKDLNIDSASSHVTDDVIVRV